MSRYLGEPNYQHDAPSCIGVLMVNLGTPSAPDPKSVRQYLAEFLKDPRVVEFPRLLWLAILHGVLLRIRPARVSRAYQQVWTDEGSPLLAISQLQAEKLNHQMKVRGTEKIQVKLAMRYGQPSIESALNELRKQGMRRLLVLPMYPQYSATTTASVFDEVARVLSSWRRIPEFRFIQNYHDHPAYIEVLANSIRDHWLQEQRSERLLMSFHGIPKRYCTAGDPYYCECYKTARLLAQALQLKDDEWKLTFQSRFGKEAWLQPYTDKILKEWAKHGVKSVDVVCPGFSADCLETLEEISEQSRDVFLSAGGEHFAYIPALNDRIDHINALSDLVLLHTQGWKDDDAVALTQSRERAEALGAQQ